MADRPKKAFTLDSYRGLVTTINPHFLPPNAAQQSTNIDYYLGGELSVRKGVAPLYPSNSRTATSFQSIASFGYSRAEAEYLTYETSDGSLHYARNVSSSGSGNNGSPVLRTGLNTFEPETMVKVPDGFLIGQNGLDRGVFWDGQSPVSYNSGMDAPLQAPTVKTQSGGGATAGTYLCYYAYLDQYSTQSNLSPYASVVTNEGDALNWSFIPPSLNPRVTQIQLWRTLVGENDTYYLVATIPNGQTSYLDKFSDDQLLLNAADDPTTSMANEINGRPNANRFGVPPTWKKVVCWFQDRAFYLADIAYDLGTVSVVSGSTLVVGSGVEWPPQFAGLYLYVVGALQPYLIDNISNTSATVMETNHGGSANATQLVSVCDGADGGTFTLTLSGQTTAPIAYNASNSQLQSAIAALSNVGAGNVTVTGNNGGPWTVQFVGSLAGHVEPAMTADASGLQVGGITVTEVQAGSASGGGNAVQKIGYQSAGGVIEGGEFTVTFNGHTTPPLPGLGYSASQMEATLLQLPSIGDNGNVTVKKTIDKITQQEWEVTFVNQLGGIAIAPMTIQTSLTSTSGGLVYTGDLESYVLVLANGGTGTGVNEIQLIQFPAGATGGTFTLSWNGQTTAPLPWNSSAADVQNALSSLSNIGVGNVSVTGGDGSFTVVFVGALAGSSQSLITGSSSGLSLGSCVTVTVLAPGGIGVVTTQTVTLPAATCGTFTLTLEGETTSPVAYNAPASGAGSVQSALTALPFVGAGNCVVTGQNGGPYTVQFSGTLQGSKVPQMIGSGDDLCGATATVVEIVKGSSGGGGGGPQSCIQAIGFATVGHDGFAYPGLTGGSFTITFNGHTTPPIAVNPRPLATDISTLLQNLPSIGTNNVDVLDTLCSEPATGNGMCGAPSNAATFGSCSDNLYGAWLMQVSFTGALANQALPQMTINTANVTFGQPPVGQFGVPPGILSTFACTTQQGSSGGGTGPTNEQQQITLPSGAQSGTFTITAGGVTTSSLAFNATAQQVQSALGNNFSVTGNDGGPYTITFINSLGDSPQSLATVDTSALKGGTVSTSVSTSGETGGNEQQALIIGNPTGGTYTLTWSAQTTTPIAYNASALQIQQALAALGAIGTGNISVVGGPTAFTITFQGALGNAAQSLIQVDVSNLKGSLTATTITLDTPYGGETTPVAEYAIRPNQLERNRIYFSESSEPESVPDVNELRIQHDQNVDDEIVGAMPFNGWLYVLKNNHIYALSYVEQPEIDAAIRCVAYRGALNHRCCALAEGVMFLMDEWGMYAFDGQAVDKIGDPVQNYWRDSLLDFTRSKWFFVKSDPNSQTVLFFVVFPGHQYPKHAFAYNYRVGSWSLREYHREIASAATIPVNGQQYIVLGTTGETFFQTEQGSLDGTLGSGTLTGTATTSGSSNLVCSSTAWPADIVFSSVGITAGNAKGQRRAVVSANKATATLTLDSPWNTAVSKGDAYSIGAVFWEYKTPIYRFLEMEGENRRQLRITYLPTTIPTTFDVRRFWDHQTSPVVVPQTQPNLGWGLSWQRNSPDLVVDISSTQSQQTQIAGWVPISDTGRLDDKTQGHRWLTYYTRGFQGAQRVKIMGMELFGLETG